MRFVVQHFRTPAFQQEMWVKILPCAPTRLSFSSQDSCLPSRERGCKSLLPHQKSRASNLEIVIAFVVQWFTTPACHAGDEGSIPSDCTKREHQFPHGFLAQLAEQMTFNHRGLGSNPREPTSTVWKLEMARALVFLTIRCTCGHGRL
jgi:hypothetical protein